VTHFSFGTDWDMLITMELEDLQASFTEQLAVTDTCLSCRAIADAVIKVAGVEDEDAFEDVDLGTWQEFRDRTQCQCCQAIVNYLERSPESQYDPSCPILFSASDDHYSLTDVKLPMGWQITIPEH
jgi:hypothetical protein